MNQHIPNPGLFILFREDFRYNAACDHQCRVYAEALGLVFWTSEIAALGLRGKQDIVLGLMFRIGP